MAAAETSGVPERSQRAAPAGAVPFDFSRPPAIEGFSPSPRVKEETFKEKFMRKTKANPFVPVGCLTTVGVLVYGLCAFQQGKTRRSQLLMRGRILAQGFTVVAIIGGVFATALKSKE
ncbi:HIG1 domain family member 2A, mitochondrial [Pholidichthys leucotaenia]